MSKHTAGPWRVIPRDGKFPNAVQRGSEGGFEVRGMDNETEDADTHLIAAAPELLEALVAVETLFGHLASDCTQKEWLDRARAAIDKATGE